MKINSQDGRENAFIFISNVAINYNEISSFYFDEDELEIHIYMKSGNEHIFCFEDVNLFEKAVYELRG